jgi:hypothetical protein
MRNIIYNLALKIVERQQAIDAKIKASEEIEKIKRREAIENHKILIDGFRKKYIEELRSNYSTNALPKFVPGQKVRLNPYAKPDVWEGSVTAHLETSPFRGPIEATILSYHIDTNCLYERIEELREGGYFDKAHTYPVFCQLLENHTNTSVYRWIMYGYTFEVFDGPEKYWKSYIREDKLVSSDSEESNDILDLWDIQEESERKKKEAYKLLDESEILLSKFYEKKEKLLYP